MEETVQHPAEQGWPRSGGTLAHHGAQISMAGTSREYKQPADSVRTCQRAEPSVNDCAFLLCEDFRPLSNRGRKRAPASQLFQFLAARQGGHAFQPEQSEEPI